MKRKRISSYHPRWNSGPKMRMRVTVFDLIKALNDEIKPGEEALVPFILLDMMEKGLFKFIDHPNGAR